MFNKIITTITFVIVALGLITNPINFKSYAIDEEPTDIELTFDTHDYDNKSIEELTQIRNRVLRKNISKVHDNEEEINYLFNATLSSEPFALLGYIKDNYYNLDEKRQIIKQIHLIDYANYAEDLIDPSGEYFKALDTYSQIDDFLVSKNKLNLRDLKDTDIVKDKYKFLIRNSEELISFCSIDEKSLMEPLVTSAFNIDSLLNDDQRQEIKSELDNKLSKNSDMEQIYNTLSEYENKDTYSPSLLMMQTTPSQYRSKALNFARKHGYSNNYNGGVPNFYVPSVGKNIQFYDFSNMGGDCANFVSMTMAYAGVDYWWKNGRSWYYYNINDRSPSWAGAGQFRWLFQYRVKAHYKFVKDDLSELRPATPISVLTNLGGGNYEAKHTLITTDRHSNGYNFSYAAHSDNGKRTNLLEKLKGREIKYYEIYW